MAVNIEKHFLSILKKYFISQYVCEAGKYIIILAVDVRKLQHKLNDTFSSSIRLC